MVLWMKTTLNIPGPLMRQLKEEAARRSTTMSALVEAGLRRILTAPEAAASPDALKPLPSWDSGGFLVDVADRETLDMVLDRDRDDAPYRDGGKR